MSVNSRKPWPRRRRRAAGTSGWGVVESEPVGELGAVGVADRDATGGGEHPQHRTADVGERHIDASERERLGVRDQPGKPQPHGAGVIEEPVEGRADRLQVEQGLVDVEDDDRSQAKHAPVLVEISDAEAKMIGLANMRSLVNNYRAELDVEMYVNLDHSPSVNAAKAGIDAGFEFIHIDYSQANENAGNEQIVAATRAVVDYAEQTTGALVESEPHYFGGSSNMHDEEIDYIELRKTFSTPGVRARSSTGRASTRSRPPSATCTAATGPPSSSTSSCCSASATRST